MFEAAFEVFEQQWKDNLTVEYVEVSNEDKLINALNNFCGALTVFDGHGGHEEDASAKLHLKGKPVDVWNLRNRLTQVPPIVVLSACDTHAADRNHATTANGLLSLGARTVLASVFPLDGRAAAIFTARLLYRVSAYLASAIDCFDQALTWSEVVAGMLRMQLLTDYLRQLERKGLIDAITYRMVHIRGNEVINNSHESDPFGIVDDVLAKLGIEKRTLHSELELAVANSSVISYLQVGRPETILIDSEKRIERQLNKCHAM
jgi:hypothetical protein